MLANDTVFNNHGEQLAAMAIRHAVPAILLSRVAAAARSMGYGDKAADFHRSALLGRAEEAALCSVPRAAISMAFASMTSVR